MSVSIFDTPVLHTLMYYIALFLLKLTGWRREGRLPDSPKYVVIAAPHTSNWDLFYTLVIAFAFKIKINWMGKEAIFRFPFGGICRWLGGIPIDRSKSHNVVEQSVRLFKERDELALVVSPEGTRQKVHSWKTGFYYIAYGAGVPIALGFLDYRRKVGGFGPAFMPTGDIESDMIEIKAFYAGVKGKYAHLTSEESIRTKQ
ncbi:MAG: lysophospholipid acyltransferase family protein [Syntrophaceae bacterium]|nr:lysophospholipid acyltransferase family protein [Syntrophaceae bacterium]